MPPDGSESGVKAYTIEVVATPGVAEGLPADAAAWVRDAQATIVRIRPRQGVPTLAPVGLRAWAPLEGEIRCQEIEGVWLLMGTHKALSSWAAHYDEAWAHELARALQNAVAPPHWNTRIGARIFQWGQRTYIMGIVNVTPDSFSGDGLYAAGDTDAWVGRAVEQALAMAAQGADVVDVGGESTRPGAAPVDAKEELRRVIPAIAAIRRQSNIPLSVDTYKAQVAEAALDAGADMINDVWGLRADPQMGALAASRGIPVVLMHNRSRPQDATLGARLGGRYEGVHYADLMLDLLEDLQGQVEQAEAWGLSRERILVDPGLGFGKTVAQNLALLRRCAALRTLGLPILLGPSRKSFIGYTLDLPPEERVYGTIASLAVAIAQGGVDMVRVHDVAAAAQAAHMADAILRPTAPPEESGD